MAEPMKGIERLARLEQLVNEARWLSNNLRTETAWAYACWDMERWKRIRRVFLKADRRFYRRLETKKQAENYARCPACKTVCRFIAEGPIEFCDNCKCWRDPGAKWMHFWKCPGCQGDELTGCEWLPLADAPQPPAAGQVTDTCGNCRQDWPCNCLDPIWHCGICGNTENYCRCTRDTQPPAAAGQGGAE